MMDNDPDTETTDRLIRIAASEMWSIRVSEHEVQAGLNRIHARMTEESSDYTKEKMNLHQRLSPRKVLTESYSGRIATITTSVLAATLLVIAGFFGLSDNDKYRNIERAEPSNFLTYSTGGAERAIVTLSDGSSVWLNAGSEMKVNSDYSSGNRTISLSGEALFTVVPKSHSPFVVNTNEASVRVLGTTFVVRNYETDTATVVAVRDGKVAVLSSVLSAGEEITISERSISAVSRTTSDRFSFTGGVLRIAATDFGNAIQDLNRWYNTEIILADSSLVTRRIAGGFKVGSIEDLQEILALMLHVRAVREGHRLTLYPR